MRAPSTPGCADASVDLVTAGQAFHWFDAAAARERIPADFAGSEMGGADLE